MRDEIRDKRREAMGRKNNREDIIEKILSRRYYREDIIEKL